MLDKSYMENAGFEQQHENQPIIHVKQQLGKQQLRKMHKISEL